MAYANVPCWIREIPNHLKTQEMCDEALRINPLSLAYFPGHLITQEMCNETMRAMPNAFHRIPDRFKSQEMCTKAVEVNLLQLKDVPGHFKTQEMCDKAARDYLFSLQFVPDWFLTWKQIDIWYDNDYVYNDHGMINWYDGYKKQKAEKSSIKEELLPIAWHPARVMDWRMPEDEKRW